MDGSQGILSGGDWSTLHLPFVPMAWIRVQSALGGEGEMKEHLRLGGTNLSFFVWGVTAQSA